MPSRDAAISDADVLETASVPALSLVDGIPDDLPPEWMPVLTAGTAEGRVTAALARWNQDFLDLVPRFAGEFRDRLLDVRLGRVAGHNELALIYLVRGRGDVLVLWMGWDPRRFREPRFWDRFPGAVKTFLQSVHAGFTWPYDGVSGGLAHVDRMTTFAEYAEEPDGFPEWDDEQEIASTRLLVFTSNGSNLFYCVSPDLPVGTLALVYPGDLDPQPFAGTVEDLMLRPLED